MKKILYYILASGFLLNEASGETIIEINPLMPLNSIELKSLKSFTKNVFLLTDGEIKFQIATFDSKEKPFTTLQNVSNGVYSAAFGHTHLLSDKEPAALLFGAPPLTAGLRFDNTTFFSWFYSAGGSDLYQEMWDELDLNIKGFILQTSGPRALGWFRKPFFSLKDLKGKLIRDSRDFTNSIHREIGLSVVPMKVADIIPELEKKNLDGVSWCCPSADLSIGIHDLIDNYYPQGASKNILNADLYLNRNLYTNLSSLQKKAIEFAASVSVIRHSSSLVYENGKALKELVENHNVTVHDTPREYFKKYQEAAAFFLNKKAQENDFFAKVWQSQKDFAIIGLPYWSKVQHPNMGLHD